MTNELQNENFEIKRPWQGTLRVILGFLRMFFITYLFFQFQDKLKMQGLSMRYSNGDPVSNIQTALFILDFTLMLKFLDGTKDNFYIKLAIVVDILFLVYFAFINTYFSITSIFMIYLSLSCLDKKFYNQKNSIIKLV